MTRLLELPGEILVDADDLKTVRPLRAAGGKHHTRIEFKSGGYAEIEASFSHVKQLLETHGVEVLS